MFRSSKPLIGTPRDKNQGGAILEFTPIGQENEHGGQTSRRTEASKHSQAIHDLIYHQKRNPLNNSPLINKVHGGSSFLEESSYDTIHYSETRANEAKTSSPVIDEFNNRDLLNNGSNPVKFQGQEVEKLQKENIALKIQISSLKRQLELVANNEQLKLYEENSKLQEKLIEYKGEINTLAKELHRARDIDSQSSKNIAEHHSAEISELNGTIRDLMEAKEEQEETFKRQIRELETLVEQYQNQSKQRLAANEKVDKLEEKVETLQDIVEEKMNVIRRKDEEIDEKDEQIEALEAKIRAVHERSEQRSEMSHATQAEADELKYLLRQKDGDCSKLEQAVREKERDLITFKEDLERARDNLTREGYKNEMLENNLKSAERKIAMLKNELDNVKGDRESRVEISELKDRNISLQSKIDLLASKLTESDAIIQEQKELLSELEQSQDKNEEIEHIKNEYSRKIQYLEKKVHDFTNKCDSLQQELNDYDGKYSELNLDYQRIHRNYNELKRNLQSTTKSAALKQSLEDQISDLVGQIDDLHFKNNKLQRDLKEEIEMKKSTSGSYAQMELKSLSSQNNQLQTEIQKKRREIDQMSSELSSKDDEILQLRDRMREIEINSHKALTKEKLELLSSKNDLEYELKALKLEKDSLKKIHDNEVKVLQSTIEMLQKRDSKEASQSREIFNYFDNDDVYEKINDKNTKIRYLHDRLEEFKSQIKQDERKIVRLEDEKSELSRLNKDQEKSLSQLEDKVLEYKRKLIRLNDGQSTSKEADILRLELKSKEKEINILNREFNDMKKYLLQKYQDVLKDKTTLQGKVDKVILKYRQLQQSANTSAPKKKLSYLEDQTELYRMKFIKSQYLISDLKFMHSFMIKSIQATNAHLQKDIRMLQNVGIYPDYDLICKKPLKLKVLLKFVVAAVRIKRKTSHGVIRNNKLEKLSTKIELLDY